jgi:hypothetical protein
MMCPDAQADLSVRTNARGRRLLFVIRVELLFGIVSLCLFIYCLIDVIQTPEESMRNLPKMPWLLIVLFLPFAGSVAWLVAGRPQASQRPAGPTRQLPNLPGFDRPGRSVASNPDDDEAFLRGIRERAEEQRRRAEEQRRRDDGDSAPDPPADGA